MEELGELAGNAERGCRLALSETSLHKVLLVVLADSGLFEVLRMLSHRFIRQKPGGRSVARPRDEELAVLTVQQRLAVGSELGRFEVAVFRFVPIFLVYLRFDVRTVGPLQVDGWQPLAAAGELHRELGERGEDDLVVALHRDLFDARRQAELQVVVHEIENVGAPVAEDPATVEIKPTPSLRVIEGVEGLFCRRATPEVPVERVGYCLAGRVVLDAFLRVVEP